MSGRKAAAVAASDRLAKLSNELAQALLGGLDTRATRAELADEQRAARRLEEVAMHAEHRRNSLVIAQIEATADRLIAEPNAQLRARLAALDLAAGQGI